MPGSGENDGQVSRKNFGCLSVYSQRGGGFAAARALGRGSRAASLLYLRIRVYWSRQPGPPHEVTLIDRNGRLAHHEDEDISQGLEEMCRDEGITVVTNAKIARVEGNSGEWIRLRGSRDGGDLFLEGTHLLVAAGRTPNTSGIGLEKAGVETTDRGYVKVNERLQTTAEGVWAIGDCAGSPQFTHISTNDSKVVIDNIAGGNRVTTGRQVPFCMFTDPELARIGLSETEAKRRGIPYRVAKLPMAAVLRAMTISETRRIYEGVDRDGKRPHPRIHHVWRRRWRRHGSRADGDACRSAVHRGTRRSHRSSHHAGRAYPPLW